MTNLYDEDYFEHGVQKGISGYENYHYIPTRSFSEAVTINNEFMFADDEELLDYGCGKGFLVHALRQVGLPTFGEDISMYALTNCHPRVKDFVSLPTYKKYSFIFCKDVLEHIEYTQDILRYFRNRCNRGLFVIPLGDDGIFRIREYEVDKTHVVKQDEDFWFDNLREAGFTIAEFSYSLGAIKEKWIPVHPYGNGFFKVY